MMCPMFIIGLSLALLVLLGGLFLLAYTKKEGLGMLSKISSYVAILFGIVVFVGGLICAIMCSSCHGKGDCNSGKGKCKVEMKGHCCEKSSMCKEGEMKCHKKIIIKHGDGEMICSKSDTGCCKDGVCKNADQDCCKAMKAEGVEKEVTVTTEVTTEKAK